MALAQNNMKISSKALDYIINHVFLPSKLPQADDNDPKYDLVLLSWVYEILDMFQHHMTADGQLGIKNAKSAIKNLIKVRDEQGNINENELQKLLQGISRNG
jgi:hypothetical protein